VKHGDLVQSSISGWIREEPDPYRGKGITRYEVGTLLLILPHQVPEYNPHNYQKVLHPNGSIGFCVIFPDDILQ
jgi:hypothetical protein